LFVEKDGQYNRQGGTAGSAVDFCTNSNW